MRLGVENCRSEFDRRDFLKSLPVAAGALYAAGAFTPPPARAESEADIVAAARAEGRGMLYTVTPPDRTAALLRAFTDRYRIPIDVQKLTGAALAQRFIAEKEAGMTIADLFVSSDPIFPRDALRKGWLKPAAGLPALDAWPESARQDGLVSVAFYPYVLAWNSMLAPEGFNSWEQLNDKRWRGKVLLGDPRVLANARLWYVAILEKFGEGFLKELGSHASYSPSVVPGLQQLAAGAMTVYAPAVHSSVVELAEKGAPVRQILIPPVIVGQPVAALPANSPHPNVARLLLNFWISREGQGIYSRDGYTLLHDVPGTLNLPGFDAIDTDAGERSLGRINALLGIG